MIDDFTSGMILVAAAVVQTAFATQYEGASQLTAFAVAGFMALGAVVLFVQSSRKSSSAYGRRADLLSEGWTAPQYEPHWETVLADMLRQIAEELRDIADDVNEESAEELREMATELDEAAAMYGEENTE